MRDALLRDLADLPYKVTTTCDVRLEAPAIAFIPIDSQQTPWLIWRKCVQQTDAAWLIAPETDNILLNLTEMACLEGAQILGCRPAAIEIASSKFNSFLQLSRAQVACVPTFDYPSWPRLPGVAYLAKPDDGAACENTVCFEDAAELEYWLAQHHARMSHIIQPYLAGISASLSCVMHAGKAILLSVNRQRVERNGHALSFSGVSVNALPELWEPAQYLAQQIAAALPSLSGYIGVDVMLHDGKLLVLEINPRLTTSYVGLRESIGCNPAELVLNMLNDPEFKPGHLSRKQVDVYV